MKPVKLLILLSTFALVACGTTTTNSSSPVVNNSSEDTSSISSDYSSEESTSQTTSESSNENSGSSTTTPDGTAKKTVTFYNGGFTSSSLNQAASQTSFVEWFNNGDNTLSSIGYDGYVQINGIDDDNNTTMILGSRNSEGKLTFNFNYPVYSVKAVVQPYTKYIAYTNTYNNDKEAKFYINTTEYDLSLDASYSGPTENKTFEKVLENSPKTFSIANKEANQRVFVHSLEITYYTVD